MVRWSGRGVLRRIHYFEEACVHVFELAHAFIEAFSHLPRTFPGSSFSGQHLLDLLDILVVGEHRLAWSAGLQGSSIPMLLGVSLGALREAHSHAGSFFRGFGVFIVRVWVPPPPCRP